MNYDDSANQADKIFFTRGGWQAKIIQDVGENPDYSHSKSFLRYKVHHSTDYGIEVFWHYNDGSCFYEDRINYCLTFKEV